MKKSQLRSLIRECIREVIKEEEETSIPKSVETADKKMTDLAKLVKQLPDDLKAKLAKKVKNAQGDVNSYIDDLKSEKEEEK
jgi:gas vesicle protein